MAKTDDFEYDVAFSFTTQDEGVATQINDLLADRLKTFIYSERQREIAGTDGQETFSKVFGNAARVVVILFRPEWGQTPWTRIEMDAIRDRSFEEGWDFTTFVPTVDSPTMPPWLPKTRLYIGLQRWGVEAAAAVIESRAVERGGQATQESVADRAGRFARASNLKKKQIEFQHSEAGVAAAKEAYEIFSLALEEVIRSVVKSGVAFNVQGSNAYRVLTGLGPVNVICWFSPHYTNSLEDIYLTVEFYKGFPQIPGWYPSSYEARKLKQFRYGYELVRTDYHSWVGIDENRREFEPHQLAEHVIKTYMDIADSTKGE